MTIDSRVLNYNAESGITTWFHFDNDTEEVTLESRQDAEPIVEHNKNLINNIADHWQGDVHQVASLPLHIWFELKKNGVIDDPKRLRAWLNDSDNRAFRTRMGRV